VPLLSVACPLFFVGCVIVVPRAKESVPVNLGIPELLIILAIIILIFGAGRLAGLGRGLGQAIRGFKDEMKPDDNADDKKGDKK
jgi:sec-independent protein translocase protein TatA